MRIITIGHSFQDILVDEQIFKTHYIVKFLRLLLTIQR